MKCVYDCSSKTLAVILMKNTCLADCLTVGVFRNTKMKLRACTVNIKPEMEFM